MIARQAGGAKLLGASETPEVFHRARIGGVAFGIGRLGSDALLEQEARHPAPSEVHRESESDGATAGDDYRNFRHNFLESAIIVMKLLRWALKRKLREGARMGDYTNEPTERC
jgi:hypothetical protein